MPENDNFDFMSDPEDETATGGSPVFGALTPEIIKEARSTYGLDIDSFYRKYGLNVNIDRLLLGPLDEDGNLL